MPTLHLHLLYHAIRPCAPLAYEVIAYFRAEQLLPPPGQETVTGQFATLTAALIEVAALPSYAGSAIGLTIERPRLRIYGRRALLKQRIARP